MLIRTPRYTANQVPNIFGFAFANGKQRPIVASSFALQVVVAILAFHFEADITALRL